MIEIEKIDEIYLQIVCSTEESLEFKDLFSYYAKDYKYQPRYKAKIWNGKISLYDHNSHLLPIGLLEEFIKYLENNNYAYKFNFDMNELFDDSFSKEELDLFLNYLFKGTKFTPRDYQIEAIQNCLYRKRGVVESCVGSGKSLMIYSIIRYLIEKYDYKCLLIVPSVSLVEQMFSDFLEYGWNDLDNFVDILYSGKIISNKNILISTWQSIYQKDKKFFDRFDVILLDECHSLSDEAKSIKSIMQKCENSKYKLGFTGTLPDEECDLYTIFGYIGSQIFELKMNFLIDEGVLSKISIANILFQYPSEIVKKYKDRNYFEEERFVESYEPRMKVLKYIFTNIYPHENVLILCRHLEHLKSIERYLLGALSDNYKVCVINGTVTPERREQLRKMMEVENNMVIVATYGTMRQGVNIKRIHHVIFASSYKSKIGVIQSIGRGERTSDDKEQLILWDIVDSLRYKKRTGKMYNNHLFKHFLERLKYYDEQKFKYQNLQITVNDLS